MQTPFASAVERHSAVVLRICRAALGPGPDADDAWSECFLSALRAWPDLDEDADVEAWLVRIAQRKTIDVLRARARHAIPVAELPEAPVPEEAHADIWSHVAALPERQRLAVAYHFLIGLPHAETAELIGGTPAAVRRASADGIRALRGSAALIDPRRGGTP